MVSKGEAQKQINKFCSDTDKKINSLDKEYLTFGATPNAPKLRYSFAI